MTFRSLSRWSLLASLFAAVIVPELQAQDLNVFMTADSEVAGPGDQVTYTLTATNSGAVDLTNVEAAVELPDHIDRLADTPPGFTCAGGCDAAEVHSWTIGSLSPGASRSVFYKVRIADDAPEGTITSSLTASASGAPDASASLDVEIHFSPLLRLSLAPEEGPAVAGEQLTYTLTFGNAGETSPTDVVLTMPLPEGTRFASATDGGVLEDDVVTWSVGIMGVGTSRDVRLVVDVEDTLAAGDVIVAEAELDPSMPTEPTNRASAATPVAADGPLELAYTISETAAEPDGMVTYTLMAANTGPVDQTDVEVDILLPGFISRLSQTPAGFSCPGGCDANERHTWTVGTLGPGESRVSYFRARLDDDAPQGELLRSRLVASSAGTGQVHAALDAAVDPSPLLRLSLKSEEGPAEPGEPLIYVLTLGNVGNTSPTEVVLTMPIPEGTTFERASGGGFLEDGVLTWNVGLLGVGASARVEAVVIPDASLPDGTLLSAEAELMTEISTARAIRASTVTPVEVDVPLEIAYTMNTTARQPDGLVTYTITAANSGPVDLTDVEVDLLLPTFISRLPQVPPGFSCPGGCDADERHTWSVGTLGPGESRVTFFRARVEDDAPQGEILRSRLVASSGGTGQVHAALDAAVDATPLLHLSLAAEGGPVEPGDSLKYTLTFGNVGTSSPAGVVVMMSIPDGTTFESATGGGVLEDDTLTWDIGLLGVDQGGRVEIVVLVDASIQNGSVLRADAKLSSGEATEADLYAYAATPVRSDVPLEITFETDGPATLPEGEVTYTLTAANTGASDLNDVSVEVLFPGFISRISPNPEGFACSGGCDADERHAWTIGTLPPGESTSVSYDVSVTADAPHGEVMNSLFLATATGSNEVVGQQDVFVGTLIQPENQPPSAAVITSPADEEMILIGSEDEEAPLPYATPFIVEWSASSDPDDDPLTYTWQMSDDPGFGDSRLELLSDNEGAANILETELGRVSDFLGGRDLEFGDSLTFYHRVITSDGIHDVSGPASKVVLTRGYIDVGIEAAQGIPGAFALHNNYPNPFNPTTTFAFDLPETAQVTLTIHDLVGRHIDTVVSSRLPAGSFQYSWDAGHLPSGVYFYRLQTDSHNAAKKLTLVK